MQVFIGKNGVVFAENRLEGSNIVKELHDSDYYVDVGIELRNQGKYEEALSKFNEAMEIRSNYLRALIQRALTYKHMGKLEEAIEDFMNIIKINPNEDNAYINLSIIYRDKGEYDKAIEYCKKALKIKKDRDSYYHLATIYEDIGELEKARVYYEWVITSDRFNSHSSKIAKEKIEEIDKILAEKQGK